MNSRMSCRTPASNRSAAVCAEAPGTDPARSKAAHARIMKCGRMRSSETELQVNDLAPEGGSAGQGSLRRIAQLLPDHVVLKLDVPVCVPVYSEGQRTFAVSEHDVGSRAG